MAIQLIDSPQNQAIFSQSPIPFIVSESNSEALTSSSFQYVAELYYWQGHQTSDKPSTSQYTLTKFPNNSGSGIFDVSRVVSSLFSEPRAADSSSVYWIEGDFYTQFKTSPSSSFVTGSHLGSGQFPVFDGYQKFQAGVQSVFGGFNMGNDKGVIQSSSAYWPIMTDGPTSQSYLDTNYGRMSIWRGLEATSGDVPTALIYSASVSGEDQSVVITFPTSSESDLQVATFPISPLEPDWPLDSDPNTIQNFEIFAINSGTNYNGTNRMNERIHFDLVCNKKYPNIRVKWKNRFGQWDYHNFNLVSRETFSVNRSQYQPQIGTWDARLLTYNDYETAIQNYIADETLKITVNSDYLNEGYNESFKQLMLSDEIYWVYQEGSEMDGTDRVRPLAIDDTQFNIKTNVVDKLIQYQFTFTQGQGYKLIF